MHLDVLKRYLVDILKTMVKNLTNKNNLSNN